MSVSRTHLSAELSLRVETHRALISVTVCPGTRASTAWNVSTSMNAVDVSMPAIATQSAQTHMGHIHVHANGGMSAMAQRVRRTTAARK